MMETKKTFKFWTAWNMEKIEKYLEEMAAKGWRLEKTSFFLMIFYFSKTQPRKTSFSVDYQNKEDKEYFSILEDAGWQCMGKSIGWFLWRQDYTEYKPEIYTDKQSLIERSKRVLWILCCSLFLQIPLLINNLEKIIQDDSFFRITNGLHLLFWSHILLIMIILGGISTVYLSSLKIRKNME